MTISLLNAEKRLDKELNYLVNKNKKGIGLITFKEFLSDKLLIISTIKTGIPYSLFSQIQTFSPFSESDWATYLGFSTKSLQRYKSNSSVFKSIHSEKIIELAEVTLMGIDVFEDVDKFNLWLNTPNYALGKITPKELLSDSYGKELVMNELVNISYGILS